MSRLRVSVAGMHDSSHYKGCSVVLVASRSTSVGRRDVPGSTWADGRASEETSVTGGSFCGGSNPGQMQPEGPLVASRRGRGACFQERPMHTRVCARRDGAAMEEAGVGGRGPFHAILPVLGFSGVRSTPVACFAGNQES